MLAEIELAGHLTAEALQEKLAAAAAKIVASAPDEPCALVVDCSTMTGYDGAARSLFVGWNAEHRSRIQRVAVVTDKMMWHLVVSAMGLTSKQEMQAFRDRSAAIDWASRPAKKKK